MMRTACFTHFANAAQRMGIAGLMLGVVWFSRVSLAQIDPMELSLIENAKLIKQFDVLIRHERYSSDKEMPLKSKWFIRLAIDFEREQMFALMTGVCLYDSDGRVYEERSIEELKKSDAKLKQRDICATYQSGGKWREFPGKSMPWTRSFREFLVRSRMPDPRGVGLIDYPTGFEGPCSLAGLDAKGTAGWSVVEVTNREVGDGIIEQVKIPRSRGTNYGMDRSRWDMTRLVPIDRGTYFVKPGQETSCISREYIEWQEISGIQVVKEISADGYVFDRSGPKPKRMLEDVITCQFHFFSVNQQLDPALLAVDADGPLGSIRDLANPKKLGVTRLMDIE